MKPYYSKEVIKHFTNPKNFGEIEDADGIGKVGNPACGDILTLYIEIAKKQNKEIIKDVKFHTLGCPAAVAVSDILCDLIKNKTLKEALKIDNKKIIKKLGGLPPIKYHCSLLAERALKMAIRDYENKKENNKKTKNSGGNVWRRGFQCSRCPIKKRG